MHPYFPVDAIRSEELNCSLLSYLTPIAHEAYSLLHQFRWDSRGQCKVTCMEAHMSTLDALNAQGSEGGKVGSQSNAYDDLTQLLGVRFTQDLHCRRVEWVGWDCPTLGAHC